jgi:hypothetical protein
MRFESAENGRRASVGGRRGRRLSRRRLGIGLLAVILIAVVAPASGARSLSVIFSPRLPPKVFNGQKVTISAFVTPAGSRCTLKIRYKGGKTDRRQRTASGSRVSWTFRVPAVAPGTATVTLSCQGAGSASGKVLVQKPMEAAKLSVGKRGYSQRPTFSGSNVSYGLELTNERKNLDAVNVSVLVNFVDDTNRVLGSAIRTVSRVPAGSTYYVGGQRPIPTQTPVARLEVVLTSATSAEKQAGLTPLISDVVIVPDTREPFVAAVRGQLLNQNPIEMRSADLGIVVLNAAGDIIGGGLTFASGPLSYGAREFFNATSTFSAIPIDQAASALVSPVPTYMSTTAK